MITRRRTPVRRPRRILDYERLSREARVKTGQAFAWFIMAIGFSVMAVAWVMAPAAAYVGFKGTVLLPVIGAIWALIEFVGKCRRIRAINKERLG
jgi:hypothetical protein